VALLITALGSTSAHADAITNYTITFTTTSGSPAPTSGSFTYDSTTPAFSNFLVTWDGGTFDLTASANSPVLVGTGCTGEASTPAYGFDIMSQTLGGCSVSYQWQSTTFINPRFFFDVGLTASPGIQDYIGGSIPSSLTAAGSSGDWTISAVTATPEPGTSVLTLSGLGLLGLLVVMRKRNSLGHRQAT